MKVDQRQILEASHQQGKANPSRPTDCRHVHTDIGLIVMNKSIALNCVGHLCVYNLAEIMLWSTLSNALIANVDKQGTE